MRYVKTLLILCALGAVAVPAFLCLGVWATKGAFEAAGQGDLRALSNVLQAATGNVLAHGDLRNLQAARGGAIDYYRAQPSELRRGQEFFRTWKSGLTIAQSSFLPGHGVTAWRSSDEIAWIDRLEVTDAWGHPFCVESTERRAIVVSAGPNALSALDCASLKLADSDVASMPHGRLNPHPSGALILVATGNGSDSSQTVASTHSE